MHDLTSVPQTNPVDIYRVRDAIYAPDMLLTALVHLDLFSWLDGASGDAERRSAARSTSPIVRPT